MPFSGCVPSPAPDNEPRLDSKRLLRALIELNIARKNMLSYPEGHHQVTDSSRRAFQHLKALLDLAGELSIGVVREGLLISDKLFEPGNAIIKDLSAVLRERLVARLQIDAGLTLEDTLSLLRLINGADRGGGSGPSPEKNAPKSALFNSIHVQFIDYSLFHHTNDLDPAGNTADIDPENPKSIWSDYVRLLGSGVLTNSSTGTPISGEPDPTPEEIARYFNLQSQHDPDLLNNLQDAIQTCLQHAAEAPASTASPSGLQKRFWQFIENLNPHMREQFLSITFDHLQNQFQQNSPQRALNDLHHSIVLEMLTQANAEGREISPTLLNFLRKMDGNRDVPQSSGGQDESAVHNPTLQRLQSILSNANALRRESYEAYVSPDYNRTLQALIPNQRGATACDATTFDTGAHIESLSDLGVTRQLGHAFLRLLRKKPHPALYREHALNLMALAEDLARFGECGLLLEVLQLFRTHGEEGGETPIEVARHCHERLLSPRLIDAVLDPICQHGRLPNAVEIELIMNLGGGAVSAVVERYLASRTPPAKDLLRKIAAASPQRLYSELARRLHSADSQQFAALLGVAALLSPDRIESLLGSFLDHEDRRIRLTALTTLVRFKQDGALRRLEAFLESDDPAAVAIAINLVEKHAVHEMLPVFMRILGRGVLLFKSDLDKIERILSAIHRIARPVPFAELERALRWKVSTHRNRLKRIKASIKPPPEPRAASPATGTPHVPLEGA
jgi:DNA-binding transcriptional regulator YbjK